MVIMPGVDLCLFLFYSFEQIQQYKTQPLGKGEVEQEDEEWQEGNFR